ncbi:hypothetical protein J1614_003939 [Plenodomus biglobosus]|nr:hypothetical protein J1614_003939 [Plenodomus biglobosus]
MHTALPTYLALSALLSQTATAFYPYLPQDIDISDSTPSSSISRRIPRPSHSDTSRTLTLPLRRVATPPLSLRARQNAYKILESADPKQENSVAIDQDGGDLSYMIAVRFGDGKEEYHLLLDSAASNTWVMAQDCTSESCRIHDTFGEGDSSTLTTQTTPFNITYGTGSVSGTLASDTLHMGTLSPTLTFGLATTVSQEFRSYPMDGILGLGRGTDTSTSTAPTTPPHSLLDALFASRQIPAKIYGIHLSRDGAADGEINLGAVNRARFTGEINYMPLIENETGFWEVRLDEAALSIDINGVETTGVVFSKDQTQRTAILDTGTSPLLIPPPDSHALHALIPNAVPKGEVYYIPCRTSATLTLTFNGVAYRVPSAEWIAGPDDNSGSSNGGVRSPNGELLCRSRIIGRQTFGPGAWLDH